MMKQIKVFSYLLCIGLLVACEKPILTDDISIGATPKLTLSIYQLEQTTFSPLRAMLSEECTRLNFAIYDLEGNRQKQINQKVGDNDFGTVAFDLPQGTYQLVALAHSSEGNPTMTNPAKVQFTNSLGYSDTFLYYTIVTIGDEPQTLALSLRRIVALCRFVISDVIPEGVVQLEFTYKGGSGHFDAKTGLGVTKSTQIERFSVQAGQQQTQYDLYTFLHHEEDDIQLKVVAYNAAGSPMYERELDPIPMEQNKITWVKGEFFTNLTPSFSQSVTTTITIDGTWGGEQYQSY